MGRNIKSYTQEYKNTIVDLFNSGKAYAEISNEYGVPKTTVRQWVNKTNNKENNDKSNENVADIKQILHIFIHKRRWMLSRFCF